MRTNQQQFDWAVQVLVKAYFDGTLEAEDCMACACGNLVAAAYGYQVKRASSYNFAWFQENKCLPYKVYWPDPVWGSAVPEDGKYYDAGAKEIELAGYTVEQFTLIEKAFMAPKNNFKGLMNVVDLLAEIHGINQEVAESSKLLFVKSC